MYYFFFAAFHEMAFHIELVFIVVIVIDVNRFFERIEIAKEEFS